MKKKLKIGLLGASQILRNKHIKAIRDADNAEIYGIASRKCEKALQYAEEFNIPHTFKTYDELLNAPEIDAVLITLPLGLHHEWIVNAAKAGKHVLCEKPMVQSVKEAEDVIRVAKKYNVKILEAFTHLYPKQIKKIHEIIDNGQIGEVKMVRAEILYPTRDWENDSRANVKLGGNVLIEAGCYCVSTIRHFIQDEPINVQGFAARKNEDGLVSSFVGIMEFPNGKLGYMSTSLETLPRMQCDIIGSAGRIEIPSLFLGEIITVYQEGSTTQIKFETKDRFQTQIEHFSDCIMNDKPLIVSLEDSLNNIRVLSSLKKSYEQR